MFSLERQVYFINGFLKLSNDSVWSVLIFRAEKSVKLRETIKKIDQTLATKIHILFLECLFNISDDHRDL